MWIALWMWVTAALGAPSAETLKATWAGYQSQWQAHAAFPIEFTEDEWQTIAKGKVGKRREKLDGADRVVGSIFIEADLDTTWLAVQDECDSYVEGLVNEDMPGATFERRLLFQSLKLPWPFAPRQWVILVQNNDTLREATQGKVWERSWDLDPTRGAKNELSNGVWLPLNDGAWILSEVPGGTLLVYHVRTVIGGNVPDEAATSWSYMTLGSMMKGVRDRVPYIREHYVGDHAPIDRPGAEPIPRF